MFLRKRQLSGGWYPDSPGKIADFLEKSRSAAAGEGQGDPEKKAAAVMVPHAGWFYSGRIAARGIASLDPSAETVLIIGGHLPGGGRPLFAGEDGIDGPFGIAEFDRELRDILVKRLNGAPDLYSDNTVEVQIPMVQYFFPKAKIVWLRLPADIRSFERGSVLAEESARLGRSCVLIASTDLSHYGVNYGFMPKGLGAEALAWMRDVNDAAFISAVLEGDPHRVLESAERDRSACSAGAVLGALAYAAARKAGPAELLMYGTSADAEGAAVPDSFVGYAALSWPLNSPSA